MACKRLVYATGVRVLAVPGKRSPGWIRYPEGKGQSGMKATNMYEREGRGGNSPQQNPTTRRGETAHSFSQFPVSYTAQGVSVTVSTVPGAVVLAWVTTRIPRRLGSKAVVAAPLGLTATV